LSDVQVGFLLGIWQIAKNHESLDIFDVRPLLQAVSGRHIPQA